MKQSQNVDIVPSEQPQQRSYSEAMLKKPYKLLPPSNSERQNVVERQAEPPKPWKTPETRPPKIETRIKVINNQDPRTTMQTLKTKLKGQDTGGSFKNIRELNNGDLIVESHSKEQQVKLKQVLEGPGIAVKEINQTDPMFMLTGIEKGWNAEDFTNELIQQNPDIKLISTEEQTNEIHIVTKRTCRNQNKENWILRAPPVIAKWFLKKGTVNFDLVSTYVQEYLPLTLCFKCCRFGHVSKYCKSEDVCFKCSGKHSAQNCEANIYKCINCILTGRETTAHTARDRECPSYKRKLEQVRQQNINYGTTQNF